MPFNSAPHVSDNNFAEMLVGDKGQNTKKVHGVPVDYSQYSAKTPASVREDKFYCPVIEYGTWAKGIRLFKTELAEVTHEALDKLADAFELAASKVEGELSDRAALDHLMNEFLVATVAIPQNDLTRKQHLFLATLADVLADAYEVLVLGESREDKPHLPHPILG